MTIPAILLIGGLTHARKEWEECASFAILKEFKGRTREEFLKELENGTYNDVIALYRSNESTSITGPFNAEVVHKLPKSLRYICHNGAGYDNIDIAECSSRGISVSSTPVAVNNATADITLFLLLGALRRMHNPYTAVRASQWRGSSFQLGHDPQEKLLGILGMGGIGREVAVRARAFGMKVQYYNRKRLSPELEQGAKYVGFEELLRTSDVLSLNLALTRETAGIVGRKEFEMMKNGVVIVNTARGKLIDEAALVDALDSGKVYSAGLDVYEEEPKVHERLLNNPNVMLLPHIGTGTIETQKKMEILVLDNLKSAVKKGILLTQVPEQLVKN